MEKLINDLSVLTNVSINSLYELLDKANLIIAHDVFENLKEKNPTTTIDIGVGSLYIKLEGENIKYKFIPSKNLEDLVCKTVSSGSSPITNRVDLVLNKRIEQTYKDLL